MINGRQYVVIAAGGGKTHFGTYRRHRRMWALPACKQQK